MTVIRYGGSFARVNVHDLIPTLSNIRWAISQRSGYARQFLFLTPASIFVAYFALKKKNIAIVGELKYMFVCMAIKAVHFEVVSDLSSKKFIAALLFGLLRDEDCSTFFPTMEFRKHK